MEKLQMAITFDRELGLRSSKNESCSTWLKEACGQSSKGIWTQKNFQKFMVYYFFIFLAFFTSFFLFQLSILVKKF